MNIRIDQLLHGYRRGHEHLAGSMRLPQRDADLVARLSDLSGTLAGTHEFKPYLTIYPLPSRSHVAVGKTWPDKTAARAGCVFTHTLLVPLNVWRTCSRPAQIATLFRQPDERRDESAYSIELHWPANAELDSPDASPMPSSMSLPFVHRYFVEGKRPVVWFSHPDAERTLWLLLRGLWPALRANFAACSLCLQPRSLEDRPFDLMFAPPEAYPRFLKIPPENFVDAARSALPATIEPWARRWADRLFSTAGMTGALGADLWSDLDDDQTAIRRLYLIENALTSDLEAPQSAVGAMDLVESVARQPGVAPHTKTLVAGRAVELASKAKDTRDGLESLRLIDDRLRRPSYQSASAQIGPRVAEEVAKYTKQDPELVASLAKPTDGPNIAGHSWFAQGLLNGFKSIAKDEPERLAALRCLPSVRASLVAVDASIGVAYARSLFARREESGARQALTEWLRSSSTGEQRATLRRSLLPGILCWQDVDLLHDILRDLSAWEVRDVITALSPAFQDASVARVIETSILRDFPEVSRSALKRLGAWDEAHLRLLSTTYPASREGLSELLNDIDVDAAHRGALAVAFLQPLGRGRFPAWVRRFAEEDESLLHALLNPLTAPSYSVDEVVAQLLRECENLPLAHFESVLSGVLRLQSRSFFPHLFDGVIRDLIRGFLNGTVAGTSAVPILSSPQTNAWMAEASYSELRLLFTHQVWNNRENWLNAWKLIQISPSSLYERESLLPDVLDSLLRAYYVAWSVPVANTWAAILQRARTECGSLRTRMQLLVQALQYSIANSRYPLSAVVVATFLDVYRAVTAPNGPLPEASSLFGWLSWDKGKELRKSLIDTFMQSQWPPGDLALAVKDEHLFRKIFKRVRRKSGGDGYLRSVLTDLEKRPSPEGRQMALFVASLLGHPEFYEEWD